MKDAEERFRALSDGFPGDENIHIREKLIRFQDALRRTLSPMDITAEELEHNQQEFLLWTQQQKQPSDADTISHLLFKDIPDFLADVSAGLPLPPGAATERTNSLEEKASPLQEMYRWMVETGRISDSYTPEKPDEISVDESSRITAEGFATWMKNMQEGFYSLALAETEETRKPEVTLPSLDSFDPHLDAAVSYKDILANEYTPVFENVFARRIAHLSTREKNVRYAFENITIYAKRHAGTRATVLIIRPGEGMCLPGVYYQAAGVAEEKFIIDANNLTYSWRHAYDEEWMSILTPIRPADVLDVPEQAVVQRFRIYIAMINQATPDGIKRSVSERFPSHDLLGSIVYEEMTKDEIQKIEQRIRSFYTIFFLIENGRLQEAQQYTKHGGEDLEENTGLILYRDTQTKILYCYVKRTDNTDLADRLRKLFSDISPNGDDGLQPA